MIYQKKNNKLLIFNRKINNYNKSIKKIKTKNYNLLKKNSKINN